VGEYLRGTIADTLTLEQQALFLKLLAMAGDGREPGVVSPGKEDGHLIGYSTFRLSGLIGCREEILKDTLPILVKQNRITVDEYGVIRIVNWQKYQSEYLRQRTGRFAKKEESKDAQQSNVTELTPEDGEALPLTDL